MNALLMPAVEQKFMEKCTNKELRLHPGSHNNNNNKNILRHRLSEQHLWQHPLFCLYVSSIEKKKQ